MKKYLSWIAIAFVAFYLLSSPNGAASIVDGIIGWLGDMADNLSTFVDSLG